MEKQKNLYQITSTLLLAFILLAGTGLFFWKAGFFEQKETPSICSKEYISLCHTEDLCKEIKLHWWDNSCHISEKPKPKPSEYPDYDSLSEMNNIVLVENFRAHVSDLSNEEDKNRNTINGYIIREEGKISKGYLEIIASVNNKPLTIWESIYFKAPTYSSLNHGGHIFRPESIKFPPDAETGEKTHLLFSLNHIPFLPPGTLYSEFEKSIYFSLFDFINNSDKIMFLAFISSNTTANIDLIKIHYKCDENENNGECKLLLKEYIKDLD